MSRVSARQGITNYFTGAAVQFVGSIYSGRPVIMPAKAYTETLLGQAVAATSAGSSAVLVVNLPRTRRRRRADTGRGQVQDTEIHEVAVEIFFAALGKNNGLQAQADFDTIADSLLTLVREDATFGGTLWSAGEYDAGIDLAQGEPYTSPDGLRIFIVATLRFEAWDWIAGSGV
jgi:hypothetical protein